MKKLLLSLAALLLLAIPAAAQEQVGRIEGKVTTNDGMGILNAAVTITSDSLVAGKMETTTDGRGRYRFQLLPIGVYTIKVTAEQYQSFEQSGIIVRIGDIVTINPELTPGTFEEVITVTGEAPLIDIKSNDMGESLGKELIAKLPVPRFPSDLIAYAPGNVGGDGGSTLGSAGASANAFKLDGVDVSDPETGTVWVFVNMESIDEVELLPIAGNTAEVGGFTGAAINMVTKSGGNEFAGGVTYYYFDEDFITWNTDDADLRDRTSRNAMNNDFTGFVGGPVLKDKVWFFGDVGLRKAGQLRRTTLSTQKYRNTMWKVSTVLRDDMNFWGLYHYDNYLVDGRFAAYNRADEATADQDGPNHSFALNYAWIIDNDNLLEIKFHGWDGRFGYTGKGDGPYIYDLVDDWGYGNSPYDYNTWRDRTSIGGVYTRYILDTGGDHELKAGLEYQTGSSEYQVRYDWIYRIAGENYYRFGYFPNDAGLQSTKALVGFVTDSWSVTDKLLINAGLRLERPTYNIPSQGDMHTFTNIAPRIGFTYQLDDQGKTLIRGSYGHYYEAVATGLLQQLYTGGSPWVEYAWIDDEWIEVYREDYSLSLYKLDPDLTGEYKEAFTIGIEHELIPNYAVGVDYIHHQYKNIVVKQQVGMQWELINYIYNTRGFQAYNRLGGSPDYLITNAPNDVLYAKYDGVMLRLTKRYSDNWQAQASLTLSNFRGTGGEGSGTFNGDDPYYDDPNNQIFAYGHFSNHVPWLFKLTGAYTFPYDITVAGYMDWRAGRTWTPTINVTGLNQGSAIVFAAERGSEKYDTYFNIDLRIEKAFRFPHIQAALLVDLYNVFNTGTITGVINRLDLDTYGDPSAIQWPRVIQLGLRLQFN